MEMVRFLGKSPEILQALQCMDDKYLKSSSDPKRRHQAQYYLSWL